MKMIITMTVGETIIKRIVVTITIQMMQIVDNLSNKVGKATQKNYTGKYGTLT